MADKTDITLGGGKLYINNVDVGYLDGDVVFAYTRTKLPFRPNDELAPVTEYISGEEASLTAQFAELNSANLRLALGMTAAVGASQSFPEYDPSSFVPAASASYDVVTFGGDKTVQPYSVRFEHIRPSGKKVVVILYSAASSKELSLTFQKEDITLTELIFSALTVEGRTAGDKLGAIITQVQAAA